MRRRVARRISSKRSKIGRARPKFGPVAPNVGRNKRGFGRIPARGGRDPASFGQLHARSGRNCSESVRDRPEVGGTTGAGTRLSVWPQWGHPGCGAICAPARLLSIVLCLSLSSFRMSHRSDTAPPGHEPLTCGSCAHGRIQHLSGPTLMFGHLWLAFDQHRPDFSQTCVTAACRVRQLENGSA